MGLNKRLISTGAGAVCTTDSVQAFGGDAAYSSNKLLYQFENNVTNDVGSPSATNSGATFSSTAKLGSYSADFAGTTQCIKTGYSANDTSLTHSFWMYQHSITGSYNAILGNYSNGGSTYAYYLWCDDPGTALNWRVHTSNSAQVEVTGTISLNTWYHVVVTWADGVGAAIYIDGSLAQFTASSLSRQQNSKELALGSIDARGVSTVGYDGLIDQYRYYNRAVSSSEAQTLYDETNATTSNTNLFNEGAGVALYSLDYDASEASGSYDGTPTDVEFGVGGKINYGARFNGSSSKIVTGVTNTIFNGFTDYSISMWINPSSLNNFFAGTINSSSYNGIYLSTEAGGVIRFFERNSTTTATTLKSTDTISANSWSHIVAVRDGGTNYLYVNNGTPVSASNSTITHSNSFQIGRPGSYAAYYPGDIDQVRIFSKALDSTEVGTLYAETACTHTATTNQHLFGCTANYNFDNSAEESMGTSAYDGVETDIEYKFGRFGQAAVFNGSSSFMTITDGGIGANGTARVAFSISLWVKFSNSKQQVFVTDYVSSGKYSFYIQAETNGQLSIGNNYTGGLNYVTGGTTAINDGNWHHLVLVNNTSTNTQKLYLDGNTTPVHNITLGTGTKAAKPIQVGEYIDLSSTYNFLGSIDQMRLFSSALSSTQVTQLYNEKPEVDTSNFKTVLYDGNGSTQYISNVGFQPEFVWIKKRSGGNTRDHMLYDSIRGAGNRLKANKDLAQSNATDELTSFEANGFFSGSSDATNGSSSSPNYVAWVWKGGGEAVLNEEGDIDSQVSANTEAGFSIVKYTGNGGSAAKTIGHGLSSAPEIIINKDLDSSSYDWAVYSSVTGNDKKLALNQSNAQATSGVWNNTNPTNSVFSVRYSQANETGNEFIAYCWHSVAGYSKIGTYTGNGNATGTIVNLDFAPSFVMIKGTDQSSDWIIIDNKRDTTNPNSARLDANSSGAEYTGENIMDLNSNGFQLKTSSASKNGLNKVFIYMAFA